MFVRLNPPRKYRADDSSGTLAFTLVEVLIVAVILAVLAAIAVPIFLHQKRKAEVSATVSSVGTLASMLATGQSTDGSLTVSQEEMALVDGSGGEITAPVPAEKGTRVSVGTKQGEDITEGTPVGDEWCISMTNPEGGVISMRTGETQPNMAGTSCYGGPALNTSAQNGGGSLASIPTNVHAVAGDASAVLTWTGSASDGGNPISNYVALATPGGRTCSAAYPTTTCTITGLTNEEAFVFAVVANNSMGSSGYSAPSNIIIPRAILSVPDAPTAPLVDGNSGSVTVSWTAPANTGGSAITSYIVTSNPGNKTCTSVDDTSCTVTGLSNGITYTFTVKARNKTGYSEPSIASDSVVPSSTPTQPLNVTGTLGNHQVTVAWEAPASDGATAISAYTVTSTPGNKTCSTSGALTCTVSTLTNGTAYTFTVTATNSRGSGMPSAPSSPITPAVAPDPPTNVHLTAGIGQIDVSWTASADDGGSSITGYTATANGGASCTIKGTACTITGLANGTSYSVSVTATNAAGSSNGASAAGGNVSTFDVPGNPTGLAGTAGDAQVALSWSAPSGNGGTAITDYKIERATSASGPWTIISHTASTSTSYTVTGLTNNTQYYFRVSAVNAVDASTPSSNVTATPVIPWNSATGGVVAAGTTIANYNNTGQTWKVHTFNSSGTFTITSASRNFRVLIVGGGYNGGSSGTDCCDKNLYGAGGGGAGGKVLDTTTTLPATPVTVLIGGSSGGTSTLWTLSSTTGTSGGAGGAGKGGSSSGGGGAGGTGYASTITGANTYYAGGGGGGAYARDQGGWGGGAGGASGGGAGGGASGDCCATGGAANGSAGTANTGGGGGGGGVSSQFNSGARSGGAGGTGIVIIAYQIG